MPQTLSQQQKISVLPHFHCWTLNSSFDFMVNTFIKHLLTNLWFGVKQLRTKLPTPT